jgi:hypothetical protein
VRQDDAVGLKDIVRRLKSSVDELDSARLQERFVHLELTPMQDATARVPLRVGGEVKGVRIVPRSGVASLDVLVSDGTGEVHAVFTGRRTLGGVHPGRAIVFEGVAHGERGELVVLNPGYTLLD